MSEVKTDDSMLPRDELLEIWRESWRQYSHEDNLWQSRDRFFVGIEVALFSGFGIVNWWFLRSGVTALTNTMIPSWLLYALLVFLLVSSGLAISYVWEKGTEASRVMAYLRWICALRAEHDLSFGNRGIATLEWLRRKHSETNPDVEFFPFRDDGCLKGERVYPLHGIRGFGATLKLIQWIRIAWIVSLVLACGAAVYGVCRA